jgi:hypothetical protein
MRIKKWSGMASNASPYAISPGVNREQINLQNVVPGQLTPRKGMQIVPNSQLGANSSGQPGAILSLYRKVQGIDLNDGMIALIAASPNNFVKELSGNVTLFTGDFTQQRPISVCEDRHGNLYVFQGGGVKPKRYTIGSPMVDMGIPAPIGAPAISRRNEDGGYYIERVDVVDGGSAYWSAPTITVNGTLGTNGRAAQLRAVVEAGTITSIDVIDPGHNYTGPVTLSFGTNTSATNTFSATATLAVTTSSGIANSSTASPTGSLTANHTVATSNDNTRVRYSVGNVTTNDQTAVATLNGSTWFVTVPLYRSSDNTDSGARVTLRLNNFVLPMTVTTAWGLSAYDSKTDPPNNNTSTYTFENLNPSGVFDAEYPAIDVGSTKYKSRWDSAASLFYADITVPGGTGVVRVRFNRNTAHATVNWSAVSPLPRGDGLSSTSYAPPSSIADVTVLSAGSGYTSSNVSFQIKYYRFVSGTNWAENGAATINLTTTGVASSTTTINLPTTYNGFSVVDAGSGWSAGQSGYIQLRSRPQSFNDSTYTTYNNAQKISFSVATSTSNGNSVANTITISNGGSGFAIAPEILYSGGGGYGLEMQSAVTNGVITAITVLDGGAGFTSAPTLSVATGGAAATAIMRPTMVGDYSCAIRWLDDSVPVSQGGPIYSSFSDITTFNAGPSVNYRSTNELLWAIPSFTSKPSRATKVELWRTSADQSLVFYKVATLTPSSTSVPNNTDRLSDEQLFDPDRTGYAALPVVLPNGNLNAYRFGQPRTDMAVCVTFQDRLWYGVSTSSAKVNSLFFSEYDEFESCPDINEIAIQQNVKDPDYLTALIPFGASLLAMQTSHCYSLSYLSDPTLDASLQLVGFRGCFNQNTWDIFEGTLYVMDERGIYSMDGSGGMQSLSDPIADVFRSKLLRKFSTSDSWLHLKIDPQTKILRAFCSFTEDGNSLYPCRALCYHIDSKTWWIERWPCQITASASLKDNVNRVEPVYASTDTKVYRLDKGAQDAASGTITSVTITSGGSGYTTPPAVTASGVGADLQAVIDGTGRVVSVVVKHGGTAYTNGGAVTFSGGGGSSAAGTVVTSSASLSVPWSFRSGNMEFPTDRDNSKGGDFESRSAALTYKPTLDARSVALRLYYNNAPVPRNNVLVRDRGTGFIQQPDSPDTTLNMQAARSSLGTATGVSKALFSGRAFDDMGGTDRHVSVELLCSAVTVAGTEPADNQTIVYELDIQGVGE